jgi:hypothetical protein
MKGLVAERLPVITEETTNQTPGKSVVPLEGPGGDLRPGMRAQAPEPWERPLLPPRPQPNPAWHGDLGVDVNGQPQSYVPDSAPEWH